MLIRGLGRTYRYYFALGLQQIHAHIGTTILQDEKGAASDAVEQKVGVT